ncbi:MAG: helix-turn-helix transcriptional regulator [Pirellulaceae bacterium]
MSSAFDAANTNEVSVPLFGCNLSLHPSQPSIAPPAYQSPATSPDASSKPGVVDASNVQSKEQLYGHSQGERSASPSMPEVSEEVKRARLAPFHRTRQVRKQQGITERTMARRLGVDIKRYRELENPATDLPLSDLRALQAALDVPLVDLLEDRHALSRPVDERAKLVKVMKTAVAMREVKANPRVERMAIMLCEQLIELMPELKEISGWPQFGARRGTSAVGKALQHPIDMSNLGSPD